MKYGETADGQYWPDLNNVRHSLSFFKGGHRIVKVRVDGKLYSVTGFGMGERFGGTEDDFVFTADSTKDEGKVDG